MLDISIHWISNRAEERVGVAGRESRQVCCTTTGSSLSIKLE